MVRLNPQYMKKGGKPEFVVLTYQEFQELLEALDDARELWDLRRARKDNGGKRGLTIAQYRSKYRVKAVS
jgi:hypothetical protein